MKKLSAETNKFKKTDLEGALKKSYVAALKNDEFKKLINRLKITEDIAIKYTSKLEDTSAELQNCTKCKGLNGCQNKVVGFVYYPAFSEEKLVFNYVACKYKKKEIAETEIIKTKFFQMPSEIKKAKMADIDGKDAKRAPIIKWLTNFYKNYEKESKQKGLYLHGSFGSGKTFLISALFNELSKNDVKAIIIYYPELLRSLKESFGADFDERMYEIKTADLILLDDIGAETVTNWNRDEILGTILQYRMDNKLPTFFTSNLTITDLENHFVVGKATDDQIKARRIIERVKQLTDNIELVSENRRK